MRARMRRLAFGLSTVLGLGRRGFFVPYRYAESVAPQDYPALRPLFAAAAPGLEATFAAIEGVADGLAAIAASGGPARFDQTWFPRLDAAAAYALVRRERPRTIVEIGSGHSTRFLAAAVRDESLPTRILCIDPAPRATLDGLVVEHVQRLLRDADPAIVGKLAPGDVLFVDSSHIAMPGTDVDRLVLDVLPRLAAGVLVHVHDIVLPDSYPAPWQWRGYNEQIVIGALLQGGGYDLVFASHYAAKAFPERLRKGILARIPLPDGAFETSLWLRKR
jgi:hypothetical protein